jgi:hypothetical protein
MALSSPLGNLFVEVQDRLKTNVAALKWIDQQFGQLDGYQPGYRPPVLFPCALIDLAGFTFEDQANGVQIVQGKVIISLSTAPFTNSNQATPTPQKEKALHFYELEHAIHKSLHGWQPAGFNRLLRRTLDKAEREDSLRERILVFDVSYTDSSAKKTTTLVARPNPVVGTDELRPN